MASIVRLTAVSGTHYSVYVNLDTVRWFLRYPGSDYTNIAYGDGEKNHTIQVTETPEEIFGMVSRG